MAPTRIRFWKKDFTRELKVAIKERDSTTKRDAHGKFTVAFFACHYVRNTTLGFIPRVA
jgi:hypothetical protein